MANPPGTSRCVDAFGTRIHLVEHGEGPVVLLVHGFPESWYSWRHQLGPLAEAGYRAVAIDVRGYGRSAKPHDVAAYGMLAHVGDNVGVLDALGVEHATVVGHDWGSPIAANSALLRPDRFRAVALLSVPYAPRGDRRPSEVYPTMVGPDEEFYIAYFQEPGRAEAEIEADVRTWLLGFYVGAAAAAPRPPDGRSIAAVRRGGRLRDAFGVPDTLPDWLGPADLDFYVGEFERSGFRGPLNRYRNVDRDFDDLTAWRKAPIAVPSLFVGGDQDGPTVWGAHAIGRFPETMPGLVGSHVLPDCGHWVQQEQPERVTDLLLAFLAEVAPT
ncbi:MAG TPA: alpha/beta hydrolase [Acidimicrobiales bacterium]|nr:alpha/beta hydrolase [Acidimicrobiales bacterium]